MKLKSIILIFATVNLSLFFILQYGCKKEEEIKIDEENPTISILYPANNSEFEEDTVIMIKADATDNIEVKEVTFLIDGNVASTDTEAPFEYEWNTSGHVGSKTIKVKALDAAKNIGESDVISVIIIKKENISVVTTSAIANISLYSAESGGNVTDDGGASVTARGVCWSTSNDPTITDSKTSDGTGTGTFTSSITGLEDNTTYYVRAYATNSTGTAYGEERLFKTLDATEPTVTTYEVTDISYTTATCGVEVTSEGTHEVTARGVCWSTTTNPTIADHKTTDGTGTGTFTSSITGLEDNTTYYVRAYATNSQGTAYGAEKTFTTTDATEPTVTTASVTDISYYTATCDGEVTSEGTHEVTARGVCWATSANPTIADHKTTDGAGTGTFTSSITALEDNTTYYVRVYATNSAGTAYGDEKSFTTFAFGSVTDYDGNTYKTVVIGSQEWMAENLKVTHYADGTEIPLVSGSSAWANLDNTDKAYCYWNRDTYGALYTYAAATNGDNDGASQGVCPTGWHLPNNEEWTELRDYLGGLYVAGGKMKEIGTTYWHSPNIGATNESGFSALPGGYRSPSDGYFYTIRDSGIWWSSTENTGIKAFYLYITNSYSWFFSGSYRGKSQGLSVRCLRD